MEDLASDEVKAEPTKEFFVSMLVRDIDLADSIVDLIDNSIDGARRLRPDGNYDGLRVALSLSQDRFQITDNCGGMSVDVARQYAFRFGRDHDNPPSPHSIGQFGVGMKRTLFKLGEHFRIESRTTDDSFTIDEHVDEWRSRTSWNFRFEALSADDDREEADTGTTITVADLRAGVAQEFGLDRFRRALASDIETKHLLALTSGLSITLDEVHLKANPLTLIETDSIRPAVWSHSYNGSKTAVEVDLYVGLSDAKQARGGWYVFCNDRLVVAANQDHLTVWGEAAGFGLPRYHAEYHEFRGYAFFRSVAPDRLPWTTTKTGVDTDSDIWRTVRQRMGVLSRNVVTFLRVADRQMDKAKTAGEEDRADLLRHLLDDAQQRPLSDLEGRAMFEHPEPDMTGLQDTYQFIRYRRPREEYEQVRELLGVNRPGDVGERTFEYYLRKRGSD